LHRSGVLFLSRVFPSSFWLFSFFSAGSLCLLAEKNKRRNGEERKGKGKKMKGRRKILNAKVAEPRLLCLPAPFLETKRGENKGGKIA